MSFGLKAVIAINYATVAVTSLIGVVLVPIYIKLLGLQEWGVVGLNIAIGGFITLLESGLGQVMPRDVAQAKDDKDRLRDLFIAYSQLYAIIAGTAAILLFVGMPTVVSVWLGVPDQGVHDAVDALRVGIFQYTFQFANIPNNCFWIGVDRQVGMNVRILIFALCRHALALVVLYASEGGAFFYCAALAVMAGAEWGVNRRAITRRLEAPFCPAAVKWRLIWDLCSRAKSVMAGVLLGLFATQSDRIFLPNVVALERYAIYTTIASAGLAILQLQNPIVRSFVPHFARCRADPTGLAVVGARYNRAVAIVFVLPLIILIACARPLLQLWLPINIDSAVVTTFRLICVASIVNAFYQRYYQSILVHHHGFGVMSINIVSVVAVGLFWWFGRRMGSIEAGGLMWLTLTFVQFFAGVVVWKRLTFKLER